MAFRLLYHPLVASDDLPQLAASARERVRLAVERCLTTHPEHFGKPLRSTLRGLWSLRVGIYRVIYRIQGPEVLILKIGHRQKVYGQALSRVRRAGPPGARA